MRIASDVRVFEIIVDGETWREAASLADAAPEDRVFTLNRADGSIVFGDGAHGQRPPAGAEVIASYRQGAEMAGNAQISVTVHWPPQACEYLVVVKKDGFKIGVSDGVASPSTTKRVRYYDGQILTAKDFEDEQQYHIEMRHRHNKLLHGSGIVTGLEVDVSGCPPCLSVIVSPGLAIDVEGREILLTATIALPIKNQQSPQLVTIECRERETDWVPSAGAGQKTPSRLEDYVLAALVVEPKKPDAVTIGRVVASASGWIIDPTFQPLKSH
jgi:hypothetical protein